MSDFSVFAAKHSQLFLILALAILALFIIEVIRARRSSHALSVTDAILKMNRERAMVIDIRDPKLFAAGHIQDAISVTSDAKTFIEKNKTHKKLRDKPYLIVCAQGVSAFRFANELMAAGKRAYVLKGGMRAWEEANMPIVKNENKTTEKQ